MEILFGLILILVVYFVAKSVQESYPSAVDKLVIKEKACPPHRWTYHDILDGDGVKHGEQMLCAVCKNPPGYSGRGDE